MQIEKVLELKGVEILVKSCIFCTQFNRKFEIKSNDCKKIKINKMAAKTLNVGFWREI